MVVNLTDWTLIPAQEDTSKLGLNFASAPSKLSLTDTKELLRHLKGVKLTSSLLWSRKMGHINTLLRKREDGSLDISVYTKLMHTDWYLHILLHS